MKTFVTFSLMALFMGVSVTSTAAQTPVKAQDDIYAVALSACVLKEGQAYGKPGLGRDYSNRIVERDTFTAPGTFTDFGSVKVEYLDSNELRERYKKSGKKIPILAVRPLRNVEGKLRINVLAYWFSYAKRSYNYGLEGGCTVEFAYDCDKKQFVVAKVELSGV